MYFVCVSSVYGMATISRLLKITGLPCRTSSLSQGSFAQETYDLKEPTNRGHPVFAYNKRGLPTSWDTENAKPLFKQSPIYIFCVSSVHLSVCEILESPILEGPPNFVRLGKGDAWNMRGKMRGEKEPHIHYTVGVSHIQCLCVSYALYVSPMYILCVSSAFLILCLSDNFWEGPILEGLFFFAKIIPIFVGLLCKSVSLLPMLAWISYQSHFDIWVLKCHINITLNIISISPWISCENHLKHHINITLNIISISLWYK